MNPSTSEPETPTSGVALNAAAGDVSEAEAVTHAIRDELVRQGGEVEEDGTVAFADGWDPEYSYVDPEPIARAALLAASKVRENSREEEARDRMMIARLKDILRCPQSVFQWREVREAAAYALAALRSAPAEQDGGWLPIETAPKDGTEILAARFWPGKPAIMAVDCWHEKGDAGYEGFGKFNMSFWPPTHWQKLPDPVSVLCGDCPPVGYPTNKTRCWTCPRGNSTHPDAAPPRSLASGSDGGVS